MTCRVFLSSASDVKPERDAVTRAVNRINADLPRGEGFELIRWEEAYYTADSAFQDQIVLSRDCDVVIAIFWKRRGSDLPEEYRRPDGTLPSGTEYEFELALEHARTSPDKVPDVLAYRKRKKVLYSEDDVDVEREQRERVLTYWNRWFRNEAGHFVAAYHNFDDTADFEPLVERHLRAWLADQSGEVRWTQGPPFRGLAPFEMEHAPVFFGRRRETERVRARFLAGALAGQRFLLIQGASGSDKSSLLRAGLLPRLLHSGGTGDLPAFSRHAIVAPDELRLAPEGWAEGLAAALLSDTALAAELGEGDFPDAAALGAYIARAGDAAAVPVARALGRAGGDGPQALVLVLDQFEQVFGWPEGEASAFCETVEALTAGAPVHVVATMRSEFQHRVAGIGALARLTSLREVRGPDQPLATIDIGTPNAADIRDMVEGPAAAAGLAYDGATDDRPDLAARIEADARPEALPALQFLLSELYERREGDLLTHAAYDALGGVAGVMARRGAAVLAESPAEERAAFSNLVRAMIRADAADAPVVARQLPPGFFDPASAEGRLAARLRDAGLLIADETGARLAHETLIAHWSDLGDVVRRERGLFEIRGRLVPLCRKWLELRGTDPKAARGTLLRGVLLAEGRDILRAWGPGVLRDPVPELPDYIAASASADRRRRTLRAGSVAAAALAVVVVGSAIAWLVVQARQDQLIADLQASVARTEAALRNGDHDAALHAVRTAAAISDAPEIRSLATTVALEHSSPHLVAHHPGNAVSVRFQPDGDIAVLGRDGRLTLGTGTDARTVALPPIPPEIEGPGARYLDFRLFPDGSIVFVATNGQIGALPPGGGDATWLSEQTYRPTSPNQFAVHLDPDGFRVAIGDRGFVAGTLLDCMAITECRRRDLPARISTVDFSRDGRRMALVGPGDLPPTVTVLGLDEAGAGDRWDAFESLSPVANAAWTGSETLAVALAQGDVAIVREGTDSDPSFAENASVAGVAVQEPSPDGTTLALQCRPDALCLLEAGASTTSFADVLYRVPAPVRAVDWSPDGGRLVSVHADGSWSQWQVKGGQRMTGRIGVSAAGLTAIDVAPDGRLAVGAGPEVRILGADAGPETGMQVGSRYNEIAHLAFSDDGSVAAVATDGRMMMRRAGADEAETATTRDMPERLAWIDGGSVVVAAPRALHVWPPGSELEEQPRLLDSGSQTIGAAIRDPAGDGFIYSRSDGALIRQARDGTAGLLVPLEQSVDRLSALSLDLSPDERWLAASRADDEVRVFDLTGESPPVSLSLRTNDSKTVAFSPDGAHIAVLGSDGLLYIWRWDDGDAAPLLVVDPVPSPLEEPDGDGREATWIAWSDPGHVAIATRSGDVLFLSISWDDVKRRLEALADVTAR